MGGEVREDDLQEQHLQSQRGALARAAWARHGSEDGPEDHGSMMRREDLLSALLSSGTGNVLCGDRATSVARTILLYRLSLALFPVQLLSGRLSCRSMFVFSLLRTVFALFSSRFSVEAEAARSIQT